MVDFESILACVFTILFDVLIILLVVLLVKYFYETLARKSSNTTNEEVPQVEVKLSENGRPISEMTMLPHHYLTA
ncbi:13071_t:CDS:2 [Ambispora leptoticha]|uniref:13071_t:CDS:1 n=1 Tax=Ambispora leptoticha TaxID=144679 RepID=A0A9N9B2X7_9GLOM|nr:13071_t:CDS:2 [Ambispora leptoticha]